MKFTIFQDTLIGRRPTNQDRTGYAYGPDRLILVAADGMGGHPRGELAAQIAVESVLGHFADWSRVSGRDAQDLLRTAFGAAHEAIHRRAEQERLWDLPRTTCTACVVQDGVALWCHVGDSRLYFVRDDAILAMTQDHSGARLLVEQGVIAPDQARAHPDRNFVYNCLGGEVGPEIEMSQPQVLRVGDRIMLCSDGFWSPVTDEEIAATLYRDATQTGLLALLRDAECRAGAYADNLSYVALAAEGDAGEDALDLKSLAPGEVVVHVAHDSISPP